MRNPFPFLPVRRSSHCKGVVSFPWKIVKRPASRFRRTARIRPVVTTAQIAIAQIQKISDKEIAAMMNSLRECLDLLRGGRARLAHILEFQCASMAAGLIERQGVVRGLSSKIQAATEAVESVLQRRDKSCEHLGALYGSEIAALHEFIAIHQFQLQQISKGEYEKILRSMAGKIGGKIGGKLQVTVAGINKRRTQTWNG